MMLPFVILLGWDIFMINIKACFPQLDEILKPGGRGDTKEQRQKFVARHIVLSIGNAAWFFFVGFAYIREAMNEPWLD